MSDDLRTRYAKTKEEQQADLDTANTLDEEAIDLREQVADLETTRLQKTGEARQIRHYVRQAMYVEDPLICEPHGKESCVEPPSVMSAGAMMHFDDGEVCYAKSLGRRSEFDPAWLEEYRRIKRG